MNHMKIPFFHTTLTGEEGLPPAILDNRSPSWQIRTTCPDDMTMWYNVYTSVVGCQVCFPTVFISKREG